MDSGDLKVFLAVARLGGMNRAATALHTVQSNVTAHIRRLERELKRPLFRRHSRGVALTPAGERLVPYAERMQQLIDEARRAATEDGAPAGRLVIGALETTAALRLSPLLAGFVTACPEVDLVLRTGTTAELTQAVLARELDGALVCGPVDHAELTAEPVFREELALLTAPKVKRLDALLSQGRLKAVVLRAGCSYRQRLEEVLARRGTVNIRLLEFGTLEAIFGCVAAGLGLTLLPRGLIGPVLRQGRVAVHALAPAEALVDTVFIRRRDGYAPSALAAFLGHIRPALAQAAAE